MPAKQTKYFPYPLRSRQVRFFASGRLLLHEWMAAHLRQHFPQQLSGYDPEHLAELIRRGEERAFGYGIESGPGICKFIDLMVVLGEDFDTRPEYQGLSCLLRDQSVGDGASRIEAVARAAVSLLQPEDAKGDR